MKNGMFGFGLASESSTRPYGSLSGFEGFVVTAFMLSTKLIRSWSMPSFWPQRSIEAIVSSDVTGSPSCHSRLLRSVKV